MHDVKPGDTEWLPRSPYAEVVLLANSDRLEKNGNTIQVEFVGGSKDYNANKSRVIMFERDWQLKCILQFKCILSWF